ncbi:MAG TPA: DUF6468 domain-containing protein, partial [Candidatus Cybelea sp.]|nr:DUF6468 domain-containing protein [Candidatus Cybelea sp.]
EEQAGRALQDRIATARGLADELSLINDSGSRIAERLAESIDSSRRVAAQRPSVIASVQEPHRSEAERELMQALRRVK